MQTQPNDQNTAQPVAQELITYFLYEPQAGDYCLLSTKPPLGLYDLFNELMI
jgi:hypothetical protein